MRKQYHFRQGPQGLLAWDVDRLLVLAAGRIMDGMHRVVKALVAGYPTITAVRFTEMPAADYVGIAPDDLPYEDA